MCVCYLFWLDGDCIYLFFCCVSNFNAVSQSLNSRFFDCLLSQFDRTERMNFSAAECILYLLIQMFIRQNCWLTPPDIFFFILALYTKLELKLKIELGRHLWIFFRKVSGLPVCAIKAAKTPVTAPKSSFCLSRLCAFSEVCLFWGELGEFIK